MDLTQEKKFKFRLRLEQEKAAAANRTPTQAAPVNPTTTSAMPPPQPEGPGMLDRISDAMPIANAVMNPTVVGLQYGTEKLNELSAKAGEFVTEQVAERFPNAPTAIPVGLGFATELASNPLNYVAPEVGYSSKLAPALGKPGFAARIKQMRTGVEASNFERLRRDPTAFFSKADRRVAGKAIGEAKEAAGINLGVTDEITSLTKGNLSKARNLQGTANKAQDEIVELLEKKNLPVVQPGSKTGDPHALYAYSDDFGPGGTKRDVYNVFGDPENPLIKQRGFGSSVPKEELEKLGIPITGREPRSDTFLQVKPDDVSTAIEGINKRLTKIERAEGAGSPSFQQWSAIKSHFQGMLEEVAPDVKSANKAFSRVALRDKFMEPFPVNQAGTFSKINAFGFSPALGAAGALVGGPGIGMATMVGAQAARSPYIAGLGTAVRGLVDKAVDPLLSGTVNALGRRSAAIGQMTTSSSQKDLHDEFTRRYIKVVD